jgi:NitT/TauT family transport system substrate-binding protein
MKNLALLFTLILLLVITACTAQTESTDPAGEAELMAISLPMGYIPDPQYAPFYVAVEKGYFAAEGIDLSFDYSFETDGIALVGANERPFAIVSGEQVILARAQELPIVYVLEWFQDYPIAIISQSSSGIQTPQDLVGRTVGLPGFWGASYVGYLGLLHATGIAPEEVNAQDIGFTQIETLLAGQADAVVGYANNEPVQLAARNEDISILYVSDFIDMVANGIITNETMIAENPALVEGFVRATLRGLADTLANPDEAFAISKQYVEGLDDSRRAVLDASLPLWQGEVPGATNAASWEQTQTVLLDANLLDVPITNLPAAYTNEFVSRVQAEMLP